MTANSSQAEPKRLNFRLLASKLIFLMHVGGTVADVAEDLRQHIAALEAELAAAHAVIAELVGPEEAGMDVSGLYEECIYCAAIGYQGADAVHDAACPVVRGRALLKGDSHA